MIQIVAKEIPSDVIFEDDLCLAFRDISPQVLGCCLISVALDTKHASPTYRLNIWYNSHAFLMKPREAAHFLCFLRQRLPKMSGFVQTGMGIQIT